MSPHQLLDDVLNWFAFHTNATLGATVKQVTIDYNERHAPSNDYLGHLVIYIGEIVDKLEKDGYIILIGNIVETRERVYKISFEGRMFALDRGYEEEFNKTTKENQRIKSIEQNQLILTCVLAIVAVPGALYAIVQLIQESNLILSFQFVGMVLVLVTGVLLGLMLILLRRELLYKSKS